MPLIVSCVLSSTSYAGLNDGLVLYFPFNGNANDESGKGYNGIVYGATLTADRFGNPNSSYGFDGIDDYIEVINNPDINPGNAITISAWYKYSSFVGDGNNSIIDKGVGSYVYPYYQYHLGISDRTYTDQNGKSDPGIIKFELSPNNTLVSNHSDVNALDYNNWCHIASVFDGSTMKLYLNGILLRIEDAIGTLQDNGRNLIIGSFSNQSSMPPGRNHFTKGSIDDIRIYNRALSEPEIKQLASSVSPSSYSFGTKAIGWQSAHQFTVTNIFNENLTIGTLSIPGDNASEFDIQNDNCSGAILAPHETRTFEVLFDPDSLGSKSANITVPFTSPSVNSWEAALSALVTEICLCDINHDGGCDMRDWLLFGDDWGRTDCTPENPCTCDLNQDGRCDMIDWSLFGQSWGRTDCPVQ